jgi:stage V sporulation protein AD
VVDTVIRYFGESELSPSDFDLIVTGDLGFEGSEILKELLYKKGYDIRKNHIDCGLIIFDRSKQDVHAGGSGCGCSASVLSSTILKNLENGAIKDILFIGTGALMSPMTLFQGEAIPGIAHLIRLRAKE